MSTVKAFQAPGSDPEFESAGISVNIPFPLAIGVENVKPEDTLPGTSPGEGLKYSSELTLSSVMVVESILVERYSNICSRPLRVRRF